MAFQRARALPPGLHIVVDVGAGSTEVSVFRHEGGGQAREIFYADRTTLLGGNDLQAAQNGPSGTVSDPGSLRNLLQRDRPLGWHESQKRRPRRGSNPVRSIAQRIRKEYVRTFGIGFGKENLESRWHEATVHCVGGGVRHPELARALRKHAWIDKFPWLEGRDEFRWDIRTTDALTDLRLNPRGRKRADLEGDASLFVVALGLSCHPLDYPDFLPPNKVRPIVKRRKPPERDPSELYSD